MVAARRLARLHVGARRDTTWLDPVTSFELLEAAGVPVAPWASARSAEECARAADGLGYPCVIKADVAGVLHKSDVGAVRLGIGDPAAAAEAYREFERRFGDGLRGVVVQAQQEAALELLVGAMRDPRSARSSSSAPAASKPSCATTGSCSLPRSPGQQPGAPSRASAWRRCSTASAAGPSSRSTGGRPRPSHRAARRTIPEIQQLDLNPVLVDARRLRRRRRADRRRGCPLRRRAGPRPARTSARIKIAKHRQRTTVIEPRRNGLAVRARPAGAPTR